VAANPEGHQSASKVGERVEVAVDDQKKADLTEDDYAAMRKVVGYVRRHSAQRPDGDVTDTPWRYSPMSWGYDPEK
jgi:hypothetical protein